MRKPSWANTGAAALVVWCCAAAAAAPVTLVGNDLDLSYDPALVGDFGTPTLVGNTLFFTPNAQRAESTNGAGLQTWASMLSGLTLQAKNGFRFGAFDLALFGDYRLSGTGSSVQVAGQLRSFDATLPASTLTNASLQLGDGATLAVNNGRLQNWAALAHIDADTAAAGGGPNAIAGGATRMGLEIDLLLTAYTDPAQAGLRQAFIENKFSGLGVTITAAPPALLPLPPTLALVLPLLLGLCGLRACSDGARNGTTRTKLGVTWGPYGAATNGGSWR